MKRKKRKRRSGANALQYLETKCRADAEVKKEEVALRQHQLSQHRNISEKGLNQQFLRTFRQA